MKASDRLEDHCHIPDQAGNSEFVELDNVVDDSLLQHSARVWDNSDKDEGAAASDISDSSEEEEMRENIENNTAEESYSQEEEGHVCDEADSEEECDSQKEGKDATGMQTKDVAVPTMVKWYEFLGGVDKSDQFMSYHRVLHQTIRYWKTLFYHLIEIMATNTFIFYKWVRMECGDK